MLPPQMAWRCCEWINEKCNKLSAYRASTVISATPENLVVMMYDGAIRFLGAAIGPSSTRIRWIST